MCVKYGTKYGADYVNKLYNGVKRNLSINHTFACFTEDNNGLDENIKVIPLKEKNSEWEDMVPKYVSEQIKEKHLFGYMPDSTES